MSVHSEKLLLSEVTRDHHPNLCIHIGMGRAGSSALQSFLYHNRESLAKNGWSYPDYKDLLCDDDVASKEMRGNMVHLSRRLCASSMDEFKRVLVCLERGLEKIRLPHILLSSEWLWNLDESIWNEFFYLAERLGRKLFIVAYIREQREWLVSVYAQRLKSKHWTISAEQFLHNLDLLKQSKTLDYFSKYNKIVKYSNESVVLFRLFEREQMLAGDVCRDLLEILKIPQNDLTFEYSKVNSSPGIVELELMRILNEAGLGLTINKRRLLRIAEDMNLKSDRRLYRLVLPETLNRISEYFHASNHSLLKVLFPGNERSSLFDSSISENYELATIGERINESSVKLLAGYFVGQ